MLFRMLPLAAVPIFGGVGLFLYFYWSATQGGAEFQPTVTTRHDERPPRLHIFFHDPTRSVFFFSQKKKSINSKDNPPRAQFESEPLCGRWWPT
jgi:hypothetical protein